MPIEVPAIFHNFAVEKKQYARHMEAKEMHNIYRSVCDAPAGSDINIDRLPHFLDHDTGDNYSPHVHTFYEVIWFEEAGGTHSVDFKDYPVEANSLFFISPGQAHHFDGITSHKGILLRFCTDILREEEYGSELFLKYDIFNAFDSSPYVVVKDPKTLDYLHSIILRIEEKSHTNDVLAHEIQRLNLNLFLLEVLQNGQREGSPMPNSNWQKPSYVLFVKFRKLVEANFMSGNTLRFYADQLNVSVKTLGNSVAECSHKTPLAFINDRIILEAKRLLRYTRLMVKEIAYRLGYEDPSYFVKFFKRETGMLPSEFREETTA